MDRNSLLQTGKKVFNLANVTDLTIKEKSVSILYAYTLDGSPTFDTVEGEEAEALKWWLYNNSVNVLLDYRTEMEYAAEQKAREEKTQALAQEHGVSVLVAGRYVRYQENGGDLSFSEWLASFNNIEDIPF